MDLHNPKSLQNGADNDWELISLLTNSKSRQSAKELTQNDQWTGNVKLKKNRRRLWPLSNVSTELETPNWLESQVVSVTGHETRDGGFESDVGKK